jgi:hypothetical protein
MTRSAFMSQNTQPCDAGPDPDRRQLILHQYAVRAIFGICRARVPARPPGASTRGLSRADRRD